VRSEGFYVNENPLTPAGIEPATYRIVAQHLNHNTHGMDIKVMKGMNLNKIGYRYISVKLQVATGSHDGTVISGILIIKRTRCTNFSNLLLE